jgi:hypothetical protein
MRVKNRPPLPTLVHRPAEVLLPADGVSARTPFPRLTLLVARHGKPRNLAPHQSQEPLRQQ